MLTFRRDISLSGESLWTDVRELQKSDCSRVLARSGKSGDKTCGKYNISHLMTLMLSLPSWSLDLHDRTTRDTKSSDIDSAFSSESLSSVARYVSIREAQMLASSGFRFPLPGGSAMAVHAAGICVVAPAEMES